VADESGRKEQLSTNTSALNIAGLLQALPFPCLLTDEAGRNLDRNAAFASLMAMLSIKTVTGRVRFGEPALQVRWQAALAQMQETPPAKPSALAASAGGRHWKFNLIALHKVLDTDVPEHSRQILVVCEEQAAASNADAVAKAGRLTKAEQGVLGGLLQGQTAKAIARERGASVNTVRSQITAILQKTGRNTQKELIASFGASSFGASAFDASSLDESSFGSSSFGPRFDAGAFDGDPLEHPPALSVPADWRPRPALKPQRTS